MSTTTKKPRLTARTLRGLEQLCRGSVLEACDGVIDRAEASEHDITEQNIADADIAIAWIYGMKAYRATLRPLVATEPTRAASAHARALGEHYEGGEGR